MDAFKLILRPGAIAAAFAAFVAIGHPNDADAVACGSGSLSLSNVQITSIDGSSVATIDATCSAGPISGNDVGAQGTLLTNLNTNNIFSGYTDDIWTLDGVTTFTPLAGDPEKGGTFTVDFTPDEYSIFALSLKGSNSYGVYLFDLSPILAQLIGGEYQMSGIINNGGQIAGLSHITSAVYGTSPTTVIPLPGSLPLLFGALAGLGYVTRRRRRA